MRAVAVLRWAIPRGPTKARKRKKQARTLTVNMVPWILLILWFTLCCLLYVQARTSVIRERYLLSGAQEEWMQLDFNNSTLHLTWATLSSPERLERVAREKLGLRKPRPDEVIPLP
jgi:cell division protein FtsL